eukprot:6106125-Amphidinium_carterae.1
MRDAQRLCLDHNCARYQHLSLLAMLSAFVHALKEKVCRYLFILIAFVDSTEPQEEMGIQG